MRSAGLGCVWFLLFTATAASGQSIRFTEATHGAARLEYVGGLPVLSLAGTPQEMGQQAAVLTAEHAKKLVQFPQQLLAAAGQSQRWPTHQQHALKLWNQFPLDQQRELWAFAEAAGIKPMDLISANTVAETIKSLGCSSLIVEPAASATGGPVFGRNLDYETLGQLHRYSLVIVYRPTGKRAFVSVGFPGFFGCLSGMNDAGLALAMHEIRSARDGSPSLDPAGVPLVQSFRQVLEECTTVDEAAALIRSLRRTTSYCLAVCDRDRGAVLEVTPKTVAVRRGTGGLCACTNHFRTSELATSLACSRYPTLAAFDQSRLLTVEEVARRLHAVNQGGRTFQTMIFQPREQVLHLAIGALPSSGQPLKKLELGPRFAPAVD